MEDSKDDESFKKSKNFLNIDLEKIYTKILGKDFVSYKFNKIILGTKRLISNNINYNDFSKEYDDVTKVSSFKYPDINYFPIAKNFEIIPIGKVRYLYDATKRRIHSSASNNVENKSTNKNRNVFLKSNSINNNTKYISKIKINSLNYNLKQEKKEKELNSVSSKKIPKYKLLGSPIHKIDKKNKKDNQLQSQNSSIGFTSNYSSKQTYNSSKKDNQTNQFFKNRLLMKNSFLNLYNYQKFIFNNRRLLRDSLLNEKYYLNLDYEEDKIFLKTDHYNNFIKSHLEDIKSNNLKFVYPEILEKEYESSKFNRPKLVLKPIIIEFQKIFSFQTKTLDKFEQTQIFEIPFEYTPIFYMYNLSKLKEILSSIFYLNEDFSKFGIKYENFPYLLKKASEFGESKIFPEIFQRNSNKKTFTSKMKSFQSLSLNKANSNKILKRGSVSSQMKENYKIINIYNNDYNFNSFQGIGTRFIQSYNNKRASNYYNIKTNNLYFSNKNSFEYIWLTPNYEYLVTIKTPAISFYIKDITINKKIDIELFFFLLENNFKDWDFYVIEYLFSFCKFCLIINNFLSIYKIKKYNFINKIVPKNKIINLSEEKKAKYSNKNSKFEYIFTDQNKNNYIKILHNYKLLAYNKRINKNYQFCFHTNCMQAKSLHYSIKKQGIKHLIKKILIFEKDSVKIKLNYNYLDNFCKADLYNLENLLQKNNGNNQEEEQENKFDFNIGDTKLSLYYPSLESIKFKENIPPNRKENCFESNAVNEIRDRLDKKILEKILKTNDLFKWPNIIEFFYLNKKEGNKRKKNAETSTGFNKVIKSVVIKNQDFLKLNEE